MVLSAEAKDILLSNLFYSSKTQYTSIKSLYDAVKNKNISYDEVKDFISKQEANQIFKRQRVSKHYFPITSKFKFEILQMDLVDMSNMASANNNYNYLLVAVDVYSRFAFAIPMKSKDSKTITESIEDIVNETSPLILNTDLGSEFISKAFVKRMTSQGTEINYVDVGEHKKLAIVDRFVRTLRSKINMYLAQHNTSKYIDVLQDIIYNYNHGYHSGIKKIPTAVKDIDADIDRLNNKKYLQALPEEEIYDIGQRVRYSLNRGTFSKGTLSKWSKTIHKIISSTLHSYTLDNGKNYKYYELQPVDEVEKLNKNFNSPTVEELKKNKQVKRKFKQSGLDTSDIITSKRETRPIERLNL